MRTVEFIFEYWARATIVYFLYDRSQEYFYLIFCGMQNERILSGIIGISTENWGWAVQWEMFEGNFADMCTNIFRSGLMGKTETSNMRRRRATTPIASAELLHDFGFWNKYCESRNNILDKITWNWLRNRVPKCCGPGGQRPCKILVCLRKVLSYE